MNKAARFLALLIGVACFALPIAAAVKLAERQAMDVETEQAQLLAREVLRRAQTISRQATSGVDRLHAARAADPCSDANIALMRELDFQSSMVQAFGHVSDEKMDCSGFGRHKPALALGRVDYISSMGVKVRANVRLPFAPEYAFVVAERDSYVAIIHGAISTDVYSDRPDISLAVVGESSGQLLIKRGEFDARWRRSMEKGTTQTFLDGRHLVAVLSEPHFDYVAYAAIPAAYLSQRARHIALTLVPIGALIGVLLTVAVLLLARQRLSLPSVMRAALRRNEFFMHYQPVVDLQSGRCIGAEALLRWRRPDGSSMLPDLFIPVAEDSGIIRQLTCRVMELVAQDAIELLRRRPDFYLALNLSSADLRSPETLEWLRAFMRDSGAQPSNIVAEATERGLIERDPKKTIIHELRAMGIKLSIDDFGTGYSSLSYLTSLKIDNLKIDKSFVDAIETNAATSHVALHIIRMAKALDLSITAEGVETASQADFLREHGVQYAQGWRYGKPMTMAELLDWLALQPS